MDMSKRVGFGYIRSHHCSDIARCIVRVLSHTARSSSFQKTFSNSILYLAGREKGIANWRGQQGLQWYLRTTVLGDNGTRNCSGLDSKVHVHFFPNTRVVRLARCLWGFDVFTRRFNVCDFAFCFFPFSFLFFWSRLFS